MYDTQSPTCAHDSVPHALHDRLYVSKVEVDEPWSDHQVCDTLDARQQHIVCKPKSVHDGRAVMFNLVFKKEKEEEEQMRERERERERERRDEKRKEEKKRQEKKS